MNTTIIWYRNDLRIADHEPLHRALAAGDVVVGWGDTADRERAGPERAVHGVSGGMTAADVMAYIGTLSA